MTTNTKTVAFVNLKGGVGKTTSAIGTAEALARLGHTVTVRDADPSGAATLWAHKALSAGRPLPFGVEVVNRFTVAAPAEEEWVLIDTPPLQTDLVEAAVDAADLVLLVTTTGPIDLERMLETIRQINKPSSVLLTQTRYGTRSLRHAEEFLAENGLAHCRETIPYKEAMRLAPDEAGSRPPRATGLSPRNSATHSTPDTRRTGNPETRVHANPWTRGHGKEQHHGDQQADDHEEHAGIDPHRLQETGQAAQDHGGARPHAQETVQGRGRATRHHHPRHAHGMDRMRLPSPRRGGRKGRGEARRKKEWMMTDDIEERAALARRGVMDHSDCEECTEDWTFLMRQGRREFPLGLRTVLACLAFAEREGAVPELPADWWVRINRRYR